MAEVTQRHRELATDVWRKATGSRPDFYNVIPAVAAFIAEACETAVAAERWRCAGIARAVMDAAAKDYKQDDESDDERDAAACWADCASQILSEIRSGEAK